MGLFDEQLGLYPNHYPTADKIGLSLTNGLWTEHEFTYIGDKRQFYTELTECERAIIIRDIVTIGQVEVAVKTFWAKIGDVLRHPAIRDLGSINSYTEVVHNRAYVKLLIEMGFQEIFDDALQNVPVLRDRVKYLRKHLNKSFADERKQFIYSLILFTLFVENVSLFSQFYVILWFDRYKNVLKDTAQQVQYTRNEENLHALSGIWLIRTLREEYPELFDEELDNLIRHEVFEAVKAEDNIIDWIIGDYVGVSPEGNKLDASVLKAYIQNRMNESLIAIEMEPVFSDIDKEALTHTRWMKEELFGDMMTDFFHKKPVDYAKNSQAFAQELIFGTDEEIEAYLTEAHTQEETTNYGGLSRDFILFHQPNA